MITASQTGRPVFAHAGFLPNRRRVALVALGRGETASSRLNLAQAFNSLGATTAPWLGGWLIFSRVTTATGTTNASRLAEAAAVKFLISS